MADMCQDFSYLWDEHVEEQEQKLKEKLREEEKQKVESDDDTRRN